MNLTVEFVFWLSVAAVMTTYFVYPALLFTVQSIRRRVTRGSD